MQDHDANHPRGSEPWRGEGHLVQVEAAVEVGLSRTDAEVDSFTTGFSGAMTVDDPYDGAIVARGRTLLKPPELMRSLRPALVYLGVDRAEVKLRVHDGTFELRIAKRAAESSKPAIEAAKYALQIWIGFGLLGFAAYQMIANWLAGIIWGVGLMGGAWQIRKGLVSGRAMLAARLSLALGMLASEGSLILPPAESERRADGAR